MAQFHFITLYPYSIALAQCYFSSMCVLRGGSADLEELAAQRSQVKLLQARYGEARAAADGGPARFEAELDLQLLRRQIATVSMHSHSRTLHPQRLSPSSKSLIRRPLRYFKRTKSDLMRTERKWNRGKPQVFKLLEKL